MKPMWAMCPECKKQVRNSLTAVVAHVKECVAAEAQKVAVAVIAERNALREELVRASAENHSLREQLQGALYGERGAA